jgi:tRNA (guanine9-N1)-methyltransferase
MASQLAFQYSTNRSAKIPISSVVHTSASSEASPRLWDRLAKSGCERWARCHFVEQDLDKIAAQWDKRKSAETKDEAAAGPSSSAGNVAAVGENPDKSVSGPMTEPEPALEGGMPDMGGLSPGGHSLVYLSADAEEELQTLREDEVYIIGGIVDRNRHKVGLGSHSTFYLYWGTIPTSPTLQLCASHNCTSIVPHVPLA